MNKYVALEKLKDLVKALERDDVEIIVHTSGVNHFSDALSEAYELLYSEGTLSRPAGPDLQVFR